jgi:hypothetical protein
MKTLETTLSQWAQVLKLILAAMLCNFEQFEISDERSAQEIATLISNSVAVWKMG